MEWFVVWNLIGMSICVWRLGRQFLADKEPSIADSIFNICMIPLWPILLYFIYED